MLAYKKQAIIEKTHKHVKDFFKNDATGHDFEHIKRVVKLTTRFITNEDYFLAVMIAYMHDLFDEKISGVANIETSFYETLVEWDLDLLGYESKILEGIMSIGFKGGFEDVERSPEASLVSDADYLDAMGAIGIARTFYYAGSKGHPIYNPDLANVDIETKADYRNKKRNAIAHFDEKLFKLKDLIVNDQAKIIAKKRHELLRDFYEEFMEEVK